MRDQNEAQPFEKWPRPSPFDKSKKVLAVTGDLRVDNGNLSVARIAKLLSSIKVPARLKIEAGVISPSQEWPQSMAPLIFRRLFLWEQSKPSGH